MSMFSNDDILLTRFITKLNPNLRIQVRAMNRRPHLTIENQEKFPEIKLKAILQEALRR